MKVALLYPGITMEGFAKTGGERPKTGWIQHGLCHISSALKKETHSVSLIDLRQLFGWEDLLGIIKRLTPDIVGITIMSMDFDAAIESARLVKATDEKIKVVVGGIHPTVMESELLNNPYVDYIFKGEAEATFPKVLDDIASSKIKGRIIQGETPDLDTIPFPDRSLFNILETPIFPFLKMPFITRVAGRGCIYNCNFCQPAERVLFGSKVRRVSVKRLMEELTLINNETGMNSLMIHDDCLAEDVKWVESFLKLYSKRPFKKPFVCQSRADIIVKNPNLFKDMRRCGLEMLLIGFESGSQRLLNFLRKGTTVEQNYKAAEICKKLGIRIFANFMLGIPTETKEEALQTIRMIKWINPYAPSPAFYTPFPGSDMFEYCIKNGLSLIAKHEEYRRDPTAPKIKGIDYGFLNDILCGVTTLPQSIKLRRKLDRLRVSRFNKDLIKMYEPARAY